MDQGTLFPLSIRPTMRDVALAVREGGEEGLPGGVRRADEATYQEVKCRSALNHVEGCRSPGRSTRIAAARTGATTASPDATIDNSS